MRRQGKGIAVAVLAAALALLALAPLAQADYDPLGSGATRLTLEKSFLALLEQNGVKLSATSPAKLKGASITFPVSGGKFDPIAEKGTIEHEGALLLTAGGRSIPIKALQLKTTQRHSPLSAKVGGSQLKLASARSLVTFRSGFGEKVKVAALTLSSKLATRLGKKLGLKGVFREGQPLGKAVTDAQPQTITVLGKGAASFSLAAGIEAKLRSLFVAVNPIFPAEHLGPQFTLPIFGGTISPDATLGTVETSGSLEFIQLGGGQAFWAENWLELAAKTLSPEVNVQPSPPYAGKQGRAPISSLAFTVPVLANARSRTVTVTGAALALAPATATTFNELFAKPQGKDGVFLAGEALGSVSFTAQGQ
jgi:hypothetical protein